MSIEEIPANFAFSDPIKAVTGDLSIKVSNSGWR